jgi:cell division septal protein FtsQ
VSGEGAQESVSQLVNQLEVWPGLHSVIKGAARVGKRRWTLYFDGGRQALLPENGVDKALAILADLEARNHVLASGIQQIDLRLAGSVVLVPFENLNEDEARKVASRTR